jgi:hypothetical protein
MEIYPQNLGKENHIKIIRHRAATAYAASAPETINMVMNQPIPPPKLGMLGRFWAKNTKMTEEQAAIGNPVVSGSTQGSGWGIGFLGLALLGLVGAIIGKESHNPALGWSIAAFGAAGGSLLGFGPIAQYSFHKAHRAISQSEIEEMIAGCQDELRKSYLQLVRDAILVDVETKPAESVREALEALMDAIAELPPVAFEPLDTDLLRQQAAEKRQSALTEMDTFTAESLVRQAESLEQRAESNEHAALIAKRSTVLREEITMKIDALREAIAAQQRGVTDAHALADLSQSARRVAREAQSTSSARDELSRYLTPPEETPVRQTLGR